MSQKEHQTEITVTFTPDELLSLIIILRGMEGHLQREYDKNSNDSSYFKEDAQAEIEHLRGFMRKIEGAYTKLSE